MSAIKLPTKTQLLLLSILWFIIGISIQIIETYRSTHQVNTIDVLVTTALLLLAVSFIYIAQNYTSTFFNNVYSRLSITTAIALLTVILQKTIILKLVTVVNYDQIFSETIVIRTAVCMMVIAFNSFTFWLLYFIKKTNVENSARSSAENSLRDAELMKLRQQIQPHFLFNSLNSINALIGTEPKLARQMIQNLSDFLRGTLKKDENKPVTLKEEIDQLKLYLEIEKIRFGHRMNIHFNINNDTLEKKLPPLILQPIVENAIKFGLYNILDKVEINIVAEMKDHLLFIEITNPFDENTSVTRKGEGFGLSNIQRRLQLIYHRADLLKIEREEKTFKTIIQIPQV